MDQDLEPYLSSTYIIDSDHRDILRLAADTVKVCGNDPVAQAVALYYAVRDGIWYDPYYPFYRPEHYKASNILKNGRRFCVCKASLLCALGRACAIPSRVGFADVRNHLTTRQLRDMMGTDLFVYHGFTEFYLEGKWVVATPAFNEELCKKHKVRPLDFNGREDSIFQPFSLENKKFMEYVTYHGSFADIPVETIVEAWEKSYTKEKVRRWIEEFEREGGNPKRNFFNEEVVK
ncbi:MAG: transglutaminase domain-containing protein [Deltaproteobacteria bacterium]|nr:transglutaminase domain-containing protein [Deltaproteobacteria bacterium]